VDGVLEDRNAGEKDHSKIQLRLAKLLDAPGKLSVFIETRVQISPTRFRVPDICACLEEPDEQIFTRPPFLCVEILSPEDRMSRMDRKIRDYLDFGVRYVWVIDPANRAATIYTPHQATLVRDETLRTSAPEILISLADLFAAL
jgi:Uma2 family endonuclease